MLQAVMLCKNIDLNDLCVNVIVKNQNFNRRIFASPFT